MRRALKRPAGLTSLALTAAVLAACAQTERREPAPVVFQGTAPAGSEAAPREQATPPQEVAAVQFGEPDGRGIVFYDGYETMRARRGDTVASMASRAGLGGAELAAYNGLSTLYQPQEGDELVLPARADGYRGAIAPPTPQPAPAQVPAASPEPTTVAAAPAASGSIPPDYTPSAGPADGAATAAQRGSGWSAELARAAIAGGDASTATPTPQPVEPVAEAPQAAEPAAAPAPEPVAAPQPAPEPEEPVAVASVAPAAAANTPFIRPTTAPVSRPFSKAPGPDRNDGVDYATSGGDPVAAADDGTVALISKSLGGLGTIVLIRHDNEFLSVYGRVDDVTVSKGDRVARGQTIARVANLTSPRKPHLHFEIRKGAESVDPELYY